jgi:hypothetical protein
MSHRFEGLWVALGVLLAAGVCFAHEGEGHAIPAPSAPSVATLHTMTAASEQFELVVKHLPLAPRKPATLDVYLSDFDSNAPVTGATLQLSLRARRGGSELWSGVAVPSDAAGIYHASLAPADTGTFNLLVSVAAGERQDQFALAGVEVRLAGAAQPAGSAAPVRRPWQIGLWALAALGALALLRLLRRLLRRRRPAAPTASALLIAALIVAGGTLGSAHEGHDEGPATSGQNLAPGDAVYLAKESQFLLGMRTVPAELQSVQKHLHVLGRVEPRNGGQLEILAPQSGRLYFPAGRTPVLGVRVARDQIVAALVVVDSLRLRSALDGVVIDVTAVNGQLVAAGQRIMTILDPAVVWVHADVYERDLASVEHSSGARIASPAYPDQVLTGRRVALGATLGEVQGTVEAYFEVGNPGGRLRVGMLVDVEIEQGGVEAALIVPRSALVEKDGRSLVFVHTAPERFAAREVSEVANLGERIAVRGNLRERDRVVIAGSYQLLTAPVVAAAHP